MTLYSRATMALTVENLLEGAQQVLPIEHASQLEKIPMAAAAIHLLSFPPTPQRHRLSNVLSLVPFYSKCIKALTFQNLCQQYGSGPSRTSAWDPQRQDNDLPYARGSERGTWYTHTHSLSLTLSLSFSLSLTNTYNRLLYLHTYVWYIYI